MPAVRGERIFCCRVLSSLTLLVALFGFAMESTAEINFLFGHVITRGLVLGPNNEPIYAEVDSGGNFLNDIGEAVGLYEHARVIPGETYREIRNRYLYHLGQHRDELAYRGVIVMTADEYKTADLGKIKVPKANWDGEGQSYTEEDISKVTLPDSVKSVLVRNPNTITDPNLLPQGDRSILFRASIDLRGGYLKHLTPDIKSVLLGEKGEVLYTSTNNIGFKAAFYTDLDGNPHDAIARDPQEDTILGPVSWAKVEPSLGYSLGPTYTDEEGKFHLNFHLPCSVYTYLAYLAVDSELYYRNYDPEAPNPTGKYYFTQDYSHVCVGTGIPGTSLISLMDHINAIGVKASMAIPYHPVDIYVDVVQLGGTGQLLSPGGVVPIGDTTEYEYVPPPGVKVAPTNLDLDNDRHYDTVVPSGDNVGVYLGEKRPVDENGQPVDPDLTVLADDQPDWRNQGLLKGISEADFKETDLYFYRASNGVLITKVEGLDQPYVTHNPKKMGISRSTNSFNYRVRIPGEWATKDTWRTLTGSLGEWQQALATPPELSGRKFDALRPEEEIKIIAINRPTGYIGIQIATIQPAKNGFLDFEIPPILMREPNLKIKAERIYTVEAGLTKGTERDYTIGFEGSALTSDTMISIKTEWFDHEGNPLPSDLEGYTGRLAKVTAPNSVEGGEVQQFKIAPGEHLEVLKFKGDILGTEHFYVHVSGYPEWRSAGVGAGAGPLKYRPKNYVPFLVPFLDDVATREARNKARYAITDETSDIEEVEAIYHWFYRPEMQFSVYEFLAKEIEIQNEAQEKETIKLDADSNPAFVGKLLADDVDVISFLYKLKEGKFPPLPSIGTARQLILAIGAQEVLASISTDGKINFEPKYLQHISKLTSADMLSIRLYQNSDPENVLWEYAFLQLDIAVDLNRDGKVEFAAEEEMEVKDAEGNTKKVATDKTTPDRPFRFWINNDLDVVNHKGEMRLEITSCGMLPQPKMPTNGDQYKQVCEQWDEDPKSRYITNTSQDQLKRIESIRDLEDFFPLSIRFISADYSSEYYLEMKAVGIGLNIFKGTWNDEGKIKAHAYIYNSGAAAQQVREANYTTGHVATLPANGTATRFTKPFFKEYFDTDGIGRFIAEGITEQPSACKDNAESCYLEISFWKGGEKQPLAKRKLYLSLQKVADYYETWTAGTAEPAGYDGDGFGFSCVAYSPGFPPQDPVAIHVDSTRNGNSWIYSGVINGEDKERVRKNRAILVHGWRMRDSEKYNFADTSFKRLYWLGYQGEFAAVTWPTGWFQNPAHCYSSAVTRVLQHSQNYDQSEVAARLTGQQLERWLVAQGGSGKKLHLIAHSMGNVVVSEALRHHDAGQLVESYSASQAAEVGGSYDDDLGEMTHTVPVVKLEMSPQDAWYLYNTTDFLSLYGVTPVILPPQPDYAMPPDIYRYTNLIKKWEDDYFVQHRQTSSTEKLRSYSNQLKTASNSTAKTHYYHGIAGKVGRLVNFFNTVDGALTAWELNQLTKPDLTGGPEWSRDWEDLCKAVEYDPVLGDAIAWEYPDGTSCPAPDAHVDGREKISRFYRDTEELSWNPKIPSGSESYSTEQRNYLQIMAHIIPARTESLGQVNIDKERKRTTSPPLFTGFTDSNHNMAGFSNSNQGHSAQFHGYLSEGGRGRAEYWKQVMNKGLDLKPNKEGHYSGLHPDVETD